MITTASFRKALMAMGFHAANNDLLVKSFPVGCSMQVDFQGQKLVFPTAIEGRERNNGFDKPENFVVFECVCRLLEKGYRPEHIELEKEWHLGHDAKSGRADICVYDNKRQSMLFIIECKTWGKQFDKAWKDTKSDGGQVFSYWQQERSCQWLIVYTSDYGDHGIDYKAPTIHCQDDANIVKMAKKDKSIKLYSKASTAQELYDVWCSTYGAQTYNALVFSVDTVAYKIGIKPLRKRDLKDFTPDDKIVNRFEEILRHNNVSDKENAFNRLVALFICKLVDEITKGNDDEVEFQYKQGTDDYETLQDRLQRLHQQGMKDFMEEEIFYVSNDYAEKLFSTYTGGTRKKAIEDLQNTIRILKFYSNNDFAFKDVHNEELFYQNGKILVEVVQLFQEYRIVYPSKHQFLGDLFEQLLNKGFKQNEGQFFTPMPITRFIWDSLPIQQIVHTDKGYYYPKVVDYACGAGHFLTEAIEAINAAIGLESPSNEWVRDSIFGIEKDYRLARVSKISLFMNGAGQGNIIFGDGLENAPDKGIDNGKFDILVANPPYSVSGFKEHLQLSNNSFTLLDCITNNGSEIEVLFVERIAQLLKPKGIAAVILPSSILSNDSTSYTAAREQLLQNFKIRAIVQLGSKTFGATGTNTVILFLEKYDEPPKRIQLVQDSIDAIFSGEEVSDWEDQQIFEAYCAQIEVTEEQYRAFLNKCPVDALKNIEHFQSYIDAFDKAKQKKGDFYSFVMPIEHEKMFYFAMTYKQETLIVVAPSDNAGQKDFLGYDWSNRKGAEGIVILKAGGMLYEDTDRTASGTIASHIQDEFREGAPVLTDEQREIAGIAQSSTMLDYSRSTFNKAIRLSARKNWNFTSKYPMMKLGKCAPFVEERIPYEQIAEKDYITTDNMLKDCAGIREFSGVALIDSVIRYKKNDILISNIRPYLKKIWLADRDGGCSPDVIVFRAKEEDEILPRYLFYILQQDIFFEYMMGDKKGTKMPRGDKAMIPQFPVPIPPLNVQQQIIDACAVIDDENNELNSIISQLTHGIDEYYDRIFGGAVSNNSHWNSVLLSTLVLTANNGLSRRSRDRDGEIVIRLAELNKGFIDYTNVNRIKLSEEEKARLLLEKGDVVFVRVNGNANNVGNCAVFEPIDEPVYHNDHIIRIRFDSRRINSYYLMYLVNSNYGKSLIQPFIHTTSGQFSISQDSLCSISIMLPPIELQNDFEKNYLETQKKIQEVQNRLKLQENKREEILKKYLQ